MNFAPHGPPAHLIDEILRAIAHPLICDVGAADGADTAGYARQYPHAKVHGFEPLARNWPRLSDAIRGLPNATAHPFALGDKDGEVPFWESGGVNDPPYSSSIYKPAEHVKHWPGITFQKRRCQIRRLDGVLDTAPDFMHIDAQGAELAVLDGCDDWLSKIAAIWLEVCVVPLYEDQPLTADVASYMTKHGFKLRLDCPTMAAVFGDQLWVRG